MKTKHIHCKDKVLAVSKIIDLYSENDMGYVNTLSGRDGELLNVDKSGGTYVVVHVDGVRLCL
jgi:hypothetical protein